MVQSPTSSNLAPQSVPGPGSSIEPSNYPEEPLDLPVAEEGGFYAAALGSTLSSRYNLIGKLGYGIHSSVWLARDENKLLISPQAYVAVKILSTYATEAQETELSEIGILQHINAYTGVHPGRRHIATLLDSFTLTDNHGQHLCLVFEALGTFKSTLYRPRDMMPLQIVKRVVKQLLLALDFLHRERGIVHTDIKPDNILLALPKSDPEKCIQHCISSRVNTEATPSMSGGSSLPIVLSHRIIPFLYNDLTNTYTLDLDFEIRLADFGTAVMVDRPHDIWIQPDALRAPEVILGLKWDCSADIWNLGCLIFEFLTGHWLFNPRGGPNWTPEGYHLGHMPKIAGEEFDVEYVRQSPLFQYFFKPEGVSLYSS